MARSRTKIAELARKHWCAPGEQVVWAVNRDAHLGSTVGATVTAPHVVLGQVPELHVADPAWPLPTRAVASGRFHRDEWVHDPAVWGWAHARPGHLAAHWADLFTAARDECWLLLTSRRSALVVEGGRTRPAEPPASGLLGHFRTRGAPEGPPLVTLWEGPAGVPRYTAVPLGRQVRPEWFVRIAFPDGSRFEFRDAQAERSVRTAYLNLAR
ncbi:hypothetical protein GCM10022243_09370 [Saccharothrix violaceirubra]|uniref:Uncharacterized protein n=1 Tax=Saccharothrix violaceirubra TaxID=413306 RepID=A0A7W7T6R0_9PSEU|nr:hypothetical protein [Saccharothrix violaceirubra]MBB4966225.1 hypothetical protein [Saccharothrix violaceirubra]